MDSSIGAQLRVEAGTPDRPLPDEDGSVIVPREHLGVGTEIEDLRSPNERARNRVVQSLHRQRRSEGLLLTTVSIAGHGDIEPAEAVIPTQRIVTEPVCQEDESGTPTTAPSRTAGCV